MWCSWVTWYWVGVSLSLSSLLSNSLLGLMDFRMSGILELEIDSQFVILGTFNLDQDVTYLWLFRSCLFCILVMTRLWCNQASDWSLRLNQALRLVRSDINRTLCNEWMFSKSLWPSKCHNKPMNLLDFTLRLFHWERLNSLNHSNHANSKL